MNRRSNLRQVEPRQRGIASTKRIKFGATRILSVVFLGMLTLMLGADEAPDQNERDAFGSLEQLRTATAEEKEALRLKRDRFMRLDSDEQQRLRDFHGQLVNHPESERLREILVRYNEWLRTLSPAKRAEIQDLPMEDRIAKIKEFKEEEARKALGFFGETQLPSQDIPWLYDWIDGFVAENEERLLASLPSRAARDVRRGRSEESRRRRLAYTLTSLSLEQLQGIVSVSDAQSLFSGLSEEAQVILGSRESDEETVLLVQRWIRYALIARWMPKVSDDELEAFYRDGLSEDERDRLDRMPPDQRKQRLLWTYHSRNTGSTRDDR